MPDMMRVDSSNVRAIGYDDDTGELTVAFDNGVYSHAGVPRFIYDKLVNAPSIGGAFNTLVKGKFKHRKLP